MVTKNILEILEFKFVFNPIFQDMDSYLNFNFKCREVDNFSKF